MLRQTLLVLAFVAFVLGGTLPVRRLPHTGPSRRFAVSRGRIVGGYDAKSGEYPYMVSLQLVVSGSRFYNCGGSIISESAVLTAGQCAVDNGYYIAVAGELDMSVDEGSEQEIRVSEQIVHPDYPGGTEVAEHDIAVFMLESPLTLNDYVQIIGLPSADSIPESGSEAVVTGWGKTYTDDTPDILQTLDVSIVSYSKCKLDIDNLDIGEQFPPDNPLTETMVCTGPVYDEISVCDGDPGSPLVMNNEVIGVVSWGIDPCGYQGAPSVYTRVSAHIDFIKQNL
ncbi:trypsin-1-like [Schistocerca nitens]|uniref:trypsin-1-like n=1 Tax=Schistocerca nitens TaxID=7011 RepID=UPI0021176EAF|nr:trypsin-1-like [Schistocerca nitens]